MSGFISINVECPWCGAKPGSSCISQDAVWIDGEFKGYRSMVFRGHLGRLATEEDGSVPLVEGDTAK